MERNFEMINEMTNQTISRLHAANLKQYVGEVTYSFYLLCNNYHKMLNGGTDQGCFDFGDCEHKMNQYSKWYATSYDIHRQMLQEMDTIINIMARERKRNV